MKSILIIGMGMLGQCLAARMQELGNDVMVIDRDEDKIQELSTIFPDALSGDCTNPAVLKSIGVNNFDYCFVALKIHTGNHHSVNASVLAMFVIR